MAMIQRHQTHLPGVRHEVEISLGITQRSVTSDIAWIGDIRKRFTDFLVWEISKDGTVIHLYDYPEDTPHANQGRLASESFPTPPPAPNTPDFEKVSDVDQELLRKLIGEQAATEVTELDANIQKKNWNLVRGKTVQFPVTEDRDARRTIHQEIRRIFSSRIDTAADSLGNITATQGSKRSNRRAENARSSGAGVQGNGNRNARMLSYEALGGDYLHFTLYKENKDTMDAINTIARLIKIKASNFAFAGTKDRRAATVQRISVIRQRQHNLVWLNQRLPGIKAGDFTHAKYPLSLGQHSGNEFVIVVKNCNLVFAGSLPIEERLRKIRDQVAKCLAYMRSRGYINYYGLQRFGTHSISTHLLGMKILSNDFEGVVDDILHVDEHLLKAVVGDGTTDGTAPDPLATTADDIARARAITAWKMTRNADTALTLLPKRFSSEGSIIRHLAMPSHGRDFMGAILSITRGMRMMYIHAYQSYVWNHVASLRWAKYGSTVIVGDLVIDDSGPKGIPLIDPAEIDENAGFQGYEDDDFFVRARHLTEEDIHSGRYTIMDVVLPTPGFDVIYPLNDIGEFYKDFMARPENGKLNPYDMRRKQREFSLSGNYRALMGRFLSDPQYSLRTYSADTEQMHPTDLDICMRNKANKKAIGAGTQPAMAANPFGVPGENRRRKAEDETPEEMANDAQEHKRARLTPQPTGGFDIAGSDQVRSAAPTLGGATSFADVVFNGRAPNPSHAAHQLAGLLRPTGIQGQEPVAPLAQQQATTPITGVQNTAVATAPTNALEQKIQVHHIVPVPKLTTVTEHSIMSLVQGNISDEAIDKSHGGEKIALILKFRLKSSNYATIVLRELMGGSPGDAL